MYHVIGRQMVYPSGKLKLKLAIPRQKRGLFPNIQPLSVSRHIHQAHWEMMPPMRVKLMVQNPVWRKI